MVTRVALTLTLMMPFLKSQIPNRTQFLISLKTSMIFQRIKKFNLTMRKTEILLMILILVSIKNR